MPRTLFDDMTQTVQPVPVSPRAFGVAPLDQTVRTANRAVPPDPNAGKNFFQRTAAGIGNALGAINDRMNTPITPAQNLGLAQIAAAIAPENSWQSRLAQTVGGQVQTDINTQYLQDILAGKEPTTQELKGVPLDVQLGARNQRLGEQNQTFEQARRVQEFDVQSSLEKMNQFIDMMNAQTQEKRADTDQFRALLSEKEFNAVYGEGKRRQFADFGGVGLYNIETGDWEVIPALVDLREKIASSSGGKDDRWSQVIQAQNQAAKAAKTYMQTKGTFVIDEATGAIKVIGDNAAAIQDYNNMYKQEFNKFFQGKDWQPNIADEDVNLFSELSLKQAVDKQYENPDDADGQEKNSFTK